VSPLESSVPGKKVVELTLLPQSKASVNKIDVFGDPDAFQKLLSLDGNPFIYLNTLLLLNIGIAINDFREIRNPSDRELTAFARGQWDEAKIRFVPVQV
jgi:hypothetical protein